MALNLTSLRKPVNRQLIDPSTGVLREEWDIFLTALTGQLNAAVADTNADIANSLLADMAQATIKGRASGAGTGDPQDLTGTQVAAILPDASTTQRGAIEHATAAEIRACTVANAAITPAGVEAAAASVALVDAATIAIDWDAGENFTVTLTANRALGNPTNGTPGTWRTVLVAGNDATDRTLTFGAQYLGDVPTITDIDDARWYLLEIFCVSASHFVVSSKKALGT